MINALVQSQGIFMSKTILKEYEVYIFFSYDYNYDMKRGAYNEKYRYS